MLKNKIISIAKCNKLEQDDIYILLAWSITGFKDIEIKSEPEDDQIEWAVDLIKKYKSKWYSYLQRGGKGDFVSYMEGILEIFPLHSAIEQIKKEEENNGEQNTGTSGEEAKGF